MVVLGVKPFLGLGHEFDWCGVYLVLIPDFNPDLLRSAGIKNWTDLHPLCQRDAQIFLVAVMNVQVPVSVDSFWLRCCVIRD